MSRKLRNALLVLTLASLAAGCGGSDNETFERALAFANIFATPSFTPIGINVLVTDETGNPAAGVPVTLALQTNPGRLLMHTSGNGEDFIQRVDPSIPSILDPLEGAFRSIDGFENNAMLYDPAQDVVYASTRFGGEFRTLDPLTGSIVTNITSTFLGNTKGLIRDGMGRLLTVVAGEGSDADLYEVDPVDGSTMSLGTITFGLAIESVNGLAIDPTDGTVFTILDSEDNVVDERRLATLDLGTLVATDVGSISEDGTPGNDGANSLAFFPDGTLYVGTGENDVLETVHTADKTTGALTPVLQLGMASDGDNLNTVPAILRGTLTVNSDASGVASFDDVMLDAVSPGYVLRADAPGFPSATSLPFIITAPDTSATVQFAAASSMIAEDGGTAMIELTVSAAQPHPIFVQLNANAGNVQFPTDGTFPSDDIDMPQFAGTTADSEIFITIPPNTTSLQIQVDVIDDGDIEPDEDLVLTLGNEEGPTGGIGLATPGALQTHTLTITDND